VALTEASLRNFREVVSRNMDLSVTINLVFAAVIAFGVVYNAAQISLSERSRDLASLRVLGFTRAEISLILLGEVAFVTLAALPFGAVFGYLLGRTIIASLASEVYRIPFVVTSGTVALSALGVVAAATLSGLVVRRKLDRLDLIAVLKSRE